MHFLSIAFGLLRMRVQLLVVVASFASRGESATAAVTRRASTELRLLDSRSSTHKSVPRDDNTTRYNATKQDEVHKREDKYNMPSSLDDGKHIFQRLAPDHVADETSIYREASTVSLYENMSRPSAAHTRKASRA